MVNWKEMSGVSGLSFTEAREAGVMWGANEIKESDQLSALHLIVRQLKKNYIVYLPVGGFFFGTV